MQESVDDLEALISSSLALEEAVSAAEQRSAAIEWLRGALVLVEDMTPGAEGPGRLLEAALIALDEGHTLPMLRSGPRSTKTASPIAEARARAIAALDWLHHVEGLPVSRASEAIDDAIGVTRGTVQRWRETSRDSRKLNQAAAALVPSITAQWKFLATLPAKLTGGAKVVLVIVAELSKDRALHRSALT